MQIGSSMRQCSETTFIEFAYLYRDAGNFKARGSVILEGRFSEEEERRLIRTLDSEELFVAEQIPVPALYAELEKISGGPTPGDHGWHAFVHVREVPPYDMPTAPLWGDAKSFLAAFEGVEAWDLTLSPNGRA